MKETRAVLAVLTGATLLGSLGAWGRAIYRYEGDPMAVVTWRALIGAMTLAALLALFQPTLLRIRARDLPFFALYGFIGVTLNFWAYFSAVKFTTLAVAITLLYTYPAFVALMSALFLRERITSTKLLAVAIRSSSGCWPRSAWRPTASSASAPWPVIHPGPWSSTPSRRAACSWRS
ncbi:MAG: DMT family transporter [candidate division NC10 bacterium]|nr:DMT family transporter [candidate division NC10 bacterium]